MDTDKKKPPMVPLDVTDADETREATGENLRYNEAEDSFELDPETADNEYQHPDPYDTAAPEGEDNNSTYDEENPYTPHEYRDRPGEMKGELENLDTTVTDAELNQLDEVDEQLANTPEDNRGDLDAEGYPRRDDAGGDGNPVLEDPGGPLIPEQREGKQVDLESRIVLPNQNLAKDFLRLARTRLFDVNHWNEIASVPVATFVLTDAYGGEAIKSQPDEGDHVRIDIPGPGTRAGDGFDWVVVTDVAEEPDAFCAITLQPASNPLKPGDDAGHFFNASASSTLVLQREEREVIARYHGRNEVANTHTESALDNIRNSVVGIGAKLGLSYPQWQGLLEGLLAHPEGEDENK